MYRRRRGAIFGNPWERLPATPGLCESMLITSMFILFCIKSKLLKSLLLLQINYYLILSTLSIFVTICFT